MNQDHITNPDNSNINKKVTFDIFEPQISISDYYYSSLKDFTAMDSKSNQHITNLSSSPPENASSASSMKFIDSTSSINSLFDNSAVNLSSTLSQNLPTLPTTTNTSTTNLTPIQSKYELKDFEFTSILNQRLLKQQEINEEKLIIMLVGLPASGKSTIAKQFKQYMNNLTNFKTEIYNAGNIRRINNKDKNNNSDYFNPNNIQGKLDRELFVDITLNNLLNDLSLGLIQIGILDATNTTRERRERMVELMNQAKSTMSANIVILDVQCFNSRFLNFNINGKANNSDYKGKDYFEAINDFKIRSNHYKQVYQPISVDELNQYSNTIIDPITNNRAISMYVKILNCGEIFEFNNINDEFKLNSKYFKFFLEFKKFYYNFERKRYLDAVDAFYNQNNE
ncbi:6-phosphofructo-2-kinase [Scheffersomyces coipomensis]|uniref:6-phosphofructo-2-kinase n=1 Tax=Scheffersomyces coipomensis TaxID=1788519 RepID=UPI00315CF2ED